MKYKKLGSTDLTVSEICLGTMTWGIQNTEADAHEQLDYATSHGITFIDTAEMYPVPPDAVTQGLTETYIGNWLTKRGKRDDLIIASKVAGPSSAINTRPAPTRLDRKSVLEAIDTSLARLKTDYLDLYQVHWPQRKTNFFGVRGFGGAPLHAPHRIEVDEVPIEETLGALDEIVKVGKARYVGVSNETAWGVTEYLRLSKEKGFARIATIQNQYSLTNRTFEIGLAELCLRENIPLLPYSPLDGGVLTGKYLGGVRPPDARFILRSRNSERYNPPQTQKAVEAYVNLAKEDGLDPAQMGLAYLLQKLFVGAVIIGASKMQQLKTDIASAEITLSPEVLAGIEQIYLEMPDPHA